MADTKIKIEKCPRCGKDHDSLKVKAFINPVVLGPYQANHFVTCPETKQIVLVNAKGCIEG